MGILVDETWIAQDGGEGEGQGGLHERESKYTVNNSFST